MPKLTTIAADRQSATAVGLHALREEVTVPLEAGMQILDAFTADQPALSEAELAAEIDLPASVLSAALDGLCRHGMLRKDGNRYISGIRSLELAFACRHELPIVQISDPIMRSIRDELDETTMLAIRSGDYRVNVAQAESRHPFRQSIPLGKPKPLYIGAGGKLLLSGLSDAEIDAYLQRVPLERMSPTTTTDHKVLLEAVQRIRKTGFAETFSERNHGGASFGAPIRCSDGKIIGALAISVPLYRYGPELRDSIVQFLTSGADEISERYALRGTRSLAH